jgi:endonuclease G, mitochondrial
MTAIVKRILLTALPLLLVFPLSACQEAQVPESQEPNRHARFGMPTSARTNPAQREDYLIQRPQYVLSYNERLHRPNWVSWSLTKEDIGRSTRGAFEPDPLLPRGFVKITSHVYDGSGFDRGHMCPAQDRSSQQKDMDGTFYLTNVVPQSPHCNQRAWERLESYCRDQTKSGHVLHIVCGPYGIGGTGKNGPRDEIGKTGTYVAVPAKVWKVILVLPDENSVPTRSTRSIAVIMPNDESVDFDWPKYRVSVSEVEKLTGYTFFRSLDHDVAEAVKEHVDTVAVRVPRSKFGAE